MFDEFSVVSTAISSFNNAALFAPYFFAMGLFCLPLFYLVYLYSHDILARLHWKADIESKISFWSVFCLMLWLLIFGGNYAVIRDGISLLPVLVAFVLFVSMLYLVKQSIKMDYLKIFKTTKQRWISLLILLVLAAFSAKPDLWGILLQVSAIMCGIIVGSRFRKNIPDLSLSTFVFGFVTTLILMQPEYFRFGQLGNLTIIHTASLLLIGFFAVTVFVVKYTNARSKIYESAYIKLKWLCRIIATLALILFALTESVPVFVGLLAVVGITEMLTIYHSKKKTEILAKQSWALLLFGFGILITCPIISCFGILYLSQLSGMPKIKDFSNLL